MIAQGLNFPAEVSTRTDRLTLATHHHKCIGHKFLDYLRRMSSNENVPVNAARKILCQCPLLLRMKVRLRLFYGDNSYLLNGAFQASLRKPSREEQLVASSLTAKSQGRIVGQIGELKVFKKFTRVRVSSHKTGLAPLAQRRDPSHLVVN